MVKVFETTDLLQAHFVRNLLVREGIRAVVLGEQLQSIMGTVPKGASPQVWVSDDRQAAAAKIVERYQGASERPLPLTAWSCPSCGERLEPQFTECWNCGASRPQSAELELPDVTVGQFLDVDVTCTGCEYNVRGLDPGGKCPECGKPIILSMLAAAETMSTMPSLELDALTQFISRTLEQSGLPTAAALFLLDAWPRALKELPPNPSVPNQAQAMELCWQLADIAIYTYDGIAEAMAALRAWGFHDCQSLGASLFNLTARGWLTHTSQLALEDFPPVPIESIFPPHGVSDLQL